MPAALPPALEIRGLTKRYPGVLALDQIDLDLHPGEIHALVGENGAGKSTLIRVLSGATPADAGTIRIIGAEFSPRDPREAQLLGIATIQQEVPLVPDLTVAENLFLGRRITRSGLVDRAATRRAARAALDRIGASISADRRAGDLSAAERQLVWIARALDQDRRVLILDEPTSSLDRAETGRLLALLRELASRGTSLLFVSHRLDEVFAIASRITVLRNGRVAASLVRATCTPLDVVRHMLGKDAPPAALVDPVEPGAHDAPVLAARGLASAAVRGIDLAVGRGEIVGLAGLLGSGRTETLRLLFGADARVAGTLVVDGRDVARSSPRRSVRAGVLLCPEERRGDALFPSLTIRENIVVSSPRRSHGGARALFERLQIRARGLDQPAGELSGGNQQKVVLARALLTRPVVLLLDEPTRGIDVGARAEIEALVRSLAKDGLGVVLVASSLDELLLLAHRVVVLKDGRIVRSLAGGRAREADVVAAMAGAAPAAAR